MHYVSLLIEKRWNKNPEWWEHQHRPMENTKDLVKEQLNGEEMTCVPLHICTWHHSAHQRYIFLKTCFVVHWNVKWVPITRCPSTRNKAGQDFPGLLSEKPINVFDLADFINIKSIVCGSAANLCRVNSRNVPCSYESLCFWASLRALIINDESVCYIK